MSAAASRNSRSFLDRRQALILPIILLIAWEVLSHSRLTPPHFFPPLEVIVSEGWAELQSGSLSTSLLASLQRDVMGFVIGSIAGLSFGMMIGFSPAAQKLFGPILLAHRQIALFAWIPLLSAWFGGGEEGKVAFIALAAFQPTLVNSWRGVANIPAQYRELAATLTFSKRDFVTVIALPGALPDIFTGLQTALIYAWGATIGSELLLNVAPGIGGRMDEGQQLFEMNLLLFYLFVLGAVGVIFNLLATRLETRLLRWRTR